MDAKTLTVGVPVRDLDLAVAWYQRALELGQPEMLPIDGLVEFNLGAFWLQLALSPETAGGDGLTANISVDDATGEHRRLSALGLAVSELQRFEGVVEYFVLTDPDGNKLGIVTELS